MPIELNITHRFDEKQFKIINIRLIEFRKTITRFLDILEKNLDKQLD